MNMSTTNSFDKYTIGIIGFLIVMVGLGVMAFLTQDSSLQTSIKDVAQKASPQAEFSVSVEAPNNSLYPSWFIFSGEVSGVRSGEVVVSNLTNQPQSLHVYGADYVPTNTGDFGLAKEEDDQKSIGSWLVPEQSDLVLEPYESRAVSYDLNIPEGTSVVDSYAGAIVVERQKPSTEDSRILLKFRVGTRVFVQLDGGQNALLAEHTS
jgi:hypothetical protein